MTGYRKEDILSGKINLMEIVVSEDQPSIFENREKLKSNPKSSIENEFRIRRKDGEIKWVREITGVSIVSRKLQETFRVWFMISLTQNG